MIWRATAIGQDSWLNPKIIALRTSCYVSSGLNTIQQQDDIFPCSYRINITTVLLGGTRRYSPTLLSGTGIHLSDRLAATPMVTGSQWGHLSADQGLSSQAGLKALHCPAQQSDLAGAGFTSVWFTMHTCSGGWGRGN